MSAGVRPDDLRRRNRAMVIGAVRRLGEASRTEIAAATGLSASTISAISADLIAEGALVETRAGEGAAVRRGRPQIGLALNPAAAGVITVVLRLNSLVATVIDYSGKAIAERRTRIPTQTSGKASILAETTAAVAALMRQPDVSHSGVARITIAVQGITDRSARRMVWSPVTAEDDIGFADALESAFGVPVTVENDCNMIAEALRWRNPERYRDNFVALLLSDGIGMGLVLNGQLFTGTQSSGWEFGHMVLRPEGALCRCGLRGCVEAYAGNYAIWRNAHGLSELSRPAGDVEHKEMQALAEAARRGEQPALSAFEAAGKAIGFGLGSLFALIDAVPVAIVGFGAGALDLIEAPLRAALGSTAGGRHGEALTLDGIDDEMPLIRQGSAMRSLTYIDNEIVAPGLSRGRLPQSAAPSRLVVTGGGGSPGAEL
jgi:predicted NBD/HSP70 family sugar kinase